jgi:3-deoxy-D-manno-octulosonic-acid transferase
VWVHAVSVGEVYAVAPIVKELHKARPNVRIVVSTITQTGHETAKKAIPEAKTYVILPFDFRFSIQRIFRLGVPSLVIFSEGDIWPMFAHEAKRRGACIALVNGKISDRTVSRLHWLDVIGQWLYSYVDIFCVQNQTFYDHFRQFHVPQKALHVTGNTKADVTFPLLSIQEKEAFRAMLGLKETDSLIVLASTHSPEEEELLPRLLPLTQSLSHAKIAIVPRHPERFSEVYRRTKELCPSVALLSAYDGSLNWDVMVVDKLGMLTKIYQVATIAIVCGSFTDRVGGHNILEPAAVGSCVLVGPYMHSQPTLYQSATEAQAVLQVTFDTAAQTVEHLLKDEDFRKSASSKAFHWAESLRGATSRTVGVLLEEAEKSWEK